jgi:NAD(P)-dependent dehydrogenase (short-subunit alcohol dehydrogenase family)
MKRFENKTAVVTGASKARGVGAVTAQLMLSEGAKVVMLDRDEESGKALAEEMGENALFIACDITSQGAVQEAFSQSIKAFGEVDILVNNAAVLSYTPVHQTSLEEWDRVMGVNITGQFLCAKYAIQSMLRKGGGAIVNVGSAQSFMSQQNVAPYVTSKHAVLGLTRSIAVDYTPTIRCNTVCPSTIDTPMLRWALEQSDNPEAMYQECVDMHLLKRIAQPEEVAELIAFLCSKAAANITGQAFRTDGGIGILIEGSNDSSVKD